MRQVRVLIFFLVSFSCFLPAQRVVLKDIPFVMEKFFKYHIEYKQVSPELVQRTIRTYIEQFDPEGIYLSDNEIKELISLSIPEIRNIALDMEKGDYSHFAKLDLLFIQSIDRSRKLRHEMATQYINEQFNQNEYLLANKLKKTLKRKMTAFFDFHEKRLKALTQEKREQIARLFEKKMLHAEETYSSHDEHNQAVRILKAFAKSLDSHTNYFSDTEAADLRMRLEKQFEGIGVVLVEGIEGIVISNILKNSPAEQSGQVQINDVIVEVNGQQVANLAYDEILQLLKKEKTVRLGISRPEQQEVIYVSLKAKPITIDEDRLSYTYENYEDGIIGKLVLKSFYENTNGVSAEKDIRKAISELKKIGTIKGLVLDLRENLGGFLSQAVKVAGIFISNGIVVVSKYSGGEVRYLRTMATQQVIDVPLVILTSKLSASASEILAQALQDYGVALVVGDKRTHGKGSIQYQTVTDPYADVFFKVTIGKYYTVSGRSTQITGVRADIVVPTCFSAYTIGEKYLPNPLPADNIDPCYNDTFNDMDYASKKWLEKFYLPNKQQRVLTWQVLLPQLKENSQRRINNNQAYQAFIEKLEYYRAHPEQIRNFRLDVDIQDFPIIEAVYILKDMITIPAYQAA